MMAQAGLAGGRVARRVTAAATAEAMAAAVAVVVVVAAAVAVVVFFFEKLSDRSIKHRCNHKRLLD